MFFITGDLHGEPKSIYTIPDRCPIGEGDTLIVAGDFGVPWTTDNIKRWRIDREIIQWFDNQPFTTAFVDGNHENYELLEEFPYATKWNGKVQRVSNNIYHLCRGELYNFDGYSVFTFGGGTSIDKHLRTEYISWWKEENANTEEQSHGLKTLSSVNWNVDYIITHTAPKIFTNHFMRAMSFKAKYPCPTQDYLDLIAEKLTWNKWYFGHFHEDMYAPAIKSRLLHENIIILGD